MSTKTKPNGAIFPIAARPEAILFESHPPFSAEDTKRFNESGAFDMAAYGNKYLCQLGSSKPFKCEKKEA